MSEGDNILAIDFDGTIIVQGSGLSRERLSKPAVAGAVDAIQRLHAEGWRIVVFSCRARDEQGRAQIINWLTRYGLADLVEDIDNFAAEAPNKRSTARSSISSPNGVDVPWEFT